MDQQMWYDSEQTSIFKDFLLFTIPFSRNMTTSDNLLFKDQSFCLSGNLPSAWQAMGNQLTGEAPVAIYPVEHYLTDLPFYEYDSRWVKQTVEQRYLHLLVVHLRRAMDLFSLSLYS